MSSRRRPRRSRAWRAALPASSPRSIGITSGSDQKQNTPLQSRSSFPSSSSDDGGGEEEEEHRFGDSAEFRLDRIPTSSSSSADLAVTPALARSQTYRVLLILVDLAVDPPPMKEHLLKSITHPVPSPQLHASGLATNELAPHDHRARVIPVVLRMVRWVQHFTVF